jgi:hypothetical protein
LLIIIENMRHLLLLSAITVVFSNCQKTKDNLYVNTDTTYNQEFVLPQVDPANPIPPEGIWVYYPKMAVATNSQALMEQYDTHASDISDVNPIIAALYTVSPYGMCFDYVDSIQLYVSTKQHGEVLAADKYGVQKNIRKIDLNPNNAANLKNYFLSDTMYYRIRAHVVSQPCKDLLRLTSTYQIFASPI